jgi:hypothetical protein
VLELAEVDLDPRDRQAFFRQEDAHPPRVRGKIGIVEFQAFLARRLPKSDPSRISGKIPFVNANVVSGSLMI